MAFCISNWMLSNASELVSSEVLWHQAFLGDHLTSLPTRHAEWIVPVKIFPEQESI